MTLEQTYVLRHIQSIQGQDVENVYFFSHVVGDGLSTALALDFESAWLPKIGALQSSNATTTGIIVYNMSDLGDFATLPLSTSGLFGPVEMLPSFAAVGYTFKLNTRAVRPGSKRIGGVPESVTTTNVITDAGYIASMELLRIAYQSPMVGAADTWQNVVVKRVKTAIAGTTPVQYTYRLPTTELDFVAGSVVAALVNRNVSSQVSRKA